MSTSHTIIKLAEETKTSPNKVAISPSSIAQHKRELFCETLKREFKNEILYAHAVHHDRATARDPFITKVSNNLKQLLSIVPDSSVKSVINAAASGASAVADKKRDQRIAVVANLVTQLDLISFDILLDKTIREVLRRYEPFIVDRLSDDDLDEGVVCLATVGARRMAEYISRLDAEIIKKNQGIILTESLLLTGLIEGRSGQIVDDYFDSNLKLKPHGLQSNHTISAECVYRHPAFQLFEVSEGKLVDELYTLPVNFKEKMKRQVKGQTKPFTTTRKKTQELAHDPKVGFIVMPRSEITKYEYKPQEKHSLSQFLQTELKTSASHSIIVIDVATLNAFLKWSKENERKSILIYMHDVLRLPNVKIVMCEGDLRECDLNQANVSHMDLSGSRIGGKDKTLNEVNFDHGFLVNARVEEGTTFNKCHFHKTHCEFLTAEKVKFEDCVLTQTNFSFANLKNAVLAESTTLGAIWHEADITGIKDEAVIEEHRKQSEQIKKDMASLRIDILARIEKLDAKIKVVQHEVKSSEHKTHHWTDDELKEMTPLLSAALKQNYQQFSHVPHLFTARKQPISDIHLTIVDHQQITTPKPHQSREIKRDFSVSPFESRFHVKNTVSLDDIFGQTSHKLIIRGEPGVGKTTLSQCIAFRSGESLWPGQFDFVFRVKLHNLKHYDTQQDKSISSIIRNECCPNMDASKQSLFDSLIAYVIKHQNNRCLFVLDGADEIAAWLDRDRSIIKKFLIEVLQSENAIITTRPHQVDKIEALIPKKNPQDIRHLETIGFTEEQIEKFINDYFPAEENEQSLAKSLQEFLQKNSRIREITHIPIYLALLCFAWGEYSKSTDLFSDQLAITGLYQIITRCLLEQYLWDKKDKSRQQYSNNDTVFYEEECFKEIFFLQFLAFHTLKNEFDEKAIIFAAEQTSVYFGKSCDVEAAMKMGFLKKIDNKYHFVHLSFQEFLAARYLTECLKHECDREGFIEAYTFIRDHRLIPRFQQLFTFVSGLTHLNKSAVPIKHFWNAVLERSPDIGVVFICRIIAFLEAAECDDRIPHLRSLIQSIRTSVNNTFTTMKEMRLDLDKGMSTGNVIREAMAKQIFPVLGMSPCVFKSAEITNLFLSKLKLIKNPASISSFLVNALAGAIFQIDDLSIPSWAVLDSTCWLMESLYIKDANDVITNELLAFPAENGVFRIFRSIPENMLSTKVIEFLLNNLDKSSALEKLLSLSKHILNDPAIKSVFVDACKNENTCIIASIVLRKLKDEELSRLKVQVMKDFQEFKPFFKPLKSKKNTELDAEVKMKLDMLERLAELIDMTPLVEYLISQSVAYYNSYWPTILRLIGATAANKKEVMQYLIRMSAQDGSAAEAVGKLAKLVEGDYYINILLEMVKSDDHAVQTAAALALCYMGKKAANRNVIDTLCVEFRKNNNPEILNTIATLSTFCPPNETVIQLYLDALKQESYENRAIAASGLGNIGNALASRDDIQDIITALLAVYRHRANDYLWNYLDLSEDRFTDLCRMRQNAAWALGQLGAVAAATKSVSEALCTTWVADARSDWMGSMSALASLKCDAKPFIRSILSDMGDYPKLHHFLISRQGFNRGLYEAQFPSHLLCQAYAKEYHPRLFELLFINSLRQGVPVSLCKDGLLLHDGNTPVLFKLSLLQIKRSQAGLFTLSMDHVIQLFTNVVFTPVPVPKMSVMSVSSAAFFASGSPKEQVITHEEKAHVTDKLRL